MVYTTGKNGDFGDSLWHWVYHISGVKRRSAEPQPLSGALENGDHVPKKLGQRSVVGTHTLL